MVGTQDTALMRSACKRLELIHQQLEIVQSELIIATAALRSLGAEQDKEIARALEYGARGRLGEQIEGMGGIIQELGGRVIQNG